MRVTPFEQESEIRDQGGQEAGHGGAAGVAQPPRAGRAAAGDARTALRRAAAGRGIQGG